MRRFLQACCVLGLVVLGSSCDQDPTDIDGMSTVSVFLTDAPGAVKAVWVKIDQIYLININGAASGSLVKLLSQPTGLIELTALVDTAKALALKVPVQPGQYNELRFILGGAVLQTKEGKVFTFGSVTPPNGLVATGQLECPVCSSSGIRVILDARLKEGSSDLVLDFDVGQSFGRDERSGKWILKPIIRALHAQHERGDDDDDDDDDDDEDRFASIEGRVRLGGTPAATIPQCPAGRRHSLEDFIPTATASTLKNADGSAVVATGHTEEDGEFKIRRLRADRWKLGFKTETVVSDAGHKLRFVGTVVPQDTTVAAGKEIEGVNYTITSTTCVAP